MWQEDYVQRTQVISSNLASVGYDSGSQVLEIEFRNRSIYHYLDVPSSVYHQLMNAPSKGKYHARCIRYNYRFQRVARAL